MKQPSSRRRAPASPASLKTTPSGRLARGVSGRLPARLPDWRDRAVPLVLVASLALGVVTGWLAGGSLQHRPHPSPAARS